MDNYLAQELNRFRQNEPDTAHVLDTYKEIEGVYREVVDAMGGTKQYRSEFKNSAEVTISFPITAQHPKP